MVSKSHSMSVSFWPVCLIVAILSALCFSPFVIVAFLPFRVQGFGDTWRVLPDGFRIARGIGPSDGLVWVGEPRRIVEVLPDEPDQIDSDMFEQLTSGKIREFAIGSERLYFLRDEFGPDFADGRLVRKDRHAYFSVDRDSRHLRGPMTIEELQKNVSQLGETIEWEPQVPKYAAALQMVSLLSVPVVPLVLTTGVIAFLTWFFMMVVGVGKPGLPTRAE